MVTVFELQCDDTNNGQILINDVKISIDCIIHNRNEPDMAHLSVIDKEKILADPNIDEKISTSIKGLMQELSNVVTKSAACEKETSDLC